MTRARKKALALAVGGVGLTLLTAASAKAATQTWNSTTSQDWFNSNNWSALTVPASGDLALFGAVNPSSSAVTLSQGTTVGGIVLDSTSTKALAVNGSGITVNLTGVPYTESLTAGTFSLQNVILGDASTKNMTTAAGITFGLPATSTIAMNQPVTLTVSSTLTGTTNLTILGAETSTTLGGDLVFLAPSPSLNGSINIGPYVAPSQGASAVVQSSTLTIAPDTAMGVGSATGNANITVNEYGQLYINSSGTNNATVYFGNTNTTLTLNGSGNGTNSGALRNNHIAANQQYVILDSVVLGTALPTDGNTGDGSTEMTAAGAGSDVVFAGPVSDPSGTQFDKAGAGILEYQNPNNTIGNGGLELGNGIVDVDTGSSIGQGNLIMYQTSTNSPQINFFNSAQTIANLLDQFKATSGSTQTVNLQGPTAGSGMVLTLNEPTNSTFGYQPAVGNNTDIGVIIGSGTLVLSNTASGVLTLNSSNNYSGGTIINGGTLNVANGTAVFNGTFGTQSFQVTPGSATGSGDVTVNNGGKLTSGLQGGNLFGYLVTGGSIAGNVNVNLGGTVTPGGANSVGVLEVGGNLNANPGSIFDFNLSGNFTAATGSRIDVGGTFTINNTGTNDILNVFGSPLATGTIPLVTFGALGNGTDTLFQVGTTPNALNQYALQYNGNTLDLVVTPTSAYTFYSLGGNTSGIDGSGVWAQGGTNFFIQNGSTTTTTTYSNNSTNPLIIGVGGAGGTITLGSNVAVNQVLAFSTVTSPYTIANSSNAYTLQINNGIIAANSATIAVPTILGSTAESVSVSVGQTLAFTGNLSEATLGSSLTLTGGGTTILSGSNSYTGGTNLTQGNLQVTTAGLPATGGVSLGSGTSLIFSQGANGTYAGVISGSGTVAINNTASAAIVLSNTGNSYTGTTILEGGILAVDNVNELGGAASSLVFNGGELLALNDLNFPGPGSLQAGQPQTSITLLAGTNTVIDNGGHNVVMNQILLGAGNLISQGSGNLTLTGEQKATGIGSLTVAAGTFTFGPLGDQSFGISGTPTGNNVNGNIVIADPMELRLSGGDFTGTGTWYVPANGVTIDSKQVNKSQTTTVIGNNIVLNAGNTSGYLVDIFADTASTLSLTGVISGNAEVAFSGGSGNTLISGANTYVGETDVDNSTGGVIQLGANNTLPVSTDVHVTGSGILDLNGFNQTVALLDSTNTAATVLNNSSTLSTLTINGSGPTTYNGFLEDGNGQLGLTLASTNTTDLKLTGNETSAQGQVGLSGPISILGGRLEVSTTTSLGAPSLITVGGQAGNSQLRFTGVSGQLAFADTATASVAASPITLAGMGGYTTASGTFDPGAISVENTSSVVMPDNVTLAATSDIQVETTSSLTLTGTVGGPGGLVVQGGGTLTLLNGNSYAGGTTINGGLVSAQAVNSLPTGGAIVNNATLDVEAANTVGNVSGTGTLVIGMSNPSVLQIASSTGKSTVGSLTVNTGSSLDLHNNGLIINYSGADPIGTIQSYLADGSSGGWATGEITSSSVVSANATQSKLIYSVGYADGADSIVAGLSSGQIEILPTLAGDAKLQGNVSFGDFQLLAANFGSSAGWDGGNFLYGSVVNFGDFQVLAQDFGSTSSGLTSSELSSLNGFAVQFGEKFVADGSGYELVSVPEPASLGFLGAAGLGLLSRRRRRSR